MPPSDEPRIPNSSIPVSATTGPPAEDWYDYWSKLGRDVARLADVPGAAPARFYSTNVLAFHAFNDMPWHVVKSSRDQVNFTVNANSPLAGNWFGNRVAQLTHVSGPCSIVHPVDGQIDTAKPYRAGVWGYGDAVDLELTTLNSNYGDDVTVGGTLTLNNPANFRNGEQAITINGRGSGAAPEWPNSHARIHSARFAIKNNTPSSDQFILAAYLIRSDQMPTDNFDLAAKSGNGGGTHEGVWEGNFLYTISHTYNQVAKFDADLNRVAVCSVGDYPHDMRKVRGDLWVVCYNGRVLNRIDAATMRLLDTIPIAGPKDGIGVADDGADLYLGVGGFQPAEIRKYEIASGTQTTISTDVHGGTANIPVCYFAGSIWSVDTTASQVKRIDPAGPTIASIDCDLGYIYGLGDDGSLIFANGMSGVAVIDPASNALVRTYRFQHIWGGASNMCRDARGRMWGCTRAGAFVIDHARGRMWEMIKNLSGAPKFVTARADDVVLGYYSMPQLELWR